MKEAADTHAGGRDSNSWSDTLNGMLHDLRGNKEASIDAMLQMRSSSISSRISSSAPPRSITPPRLTGAISKTLCGGDGVEAEPPMRAASHSRRFRCSCCGNRGAAASISAKVDIAELYPRPDGRQTRLDFGARANRAGDAGNFRILAVQPAEREPDVEPQRFSNPWLKSRAPVHRGIGPGSRRRDAAVLQLNTGKSRQR
jgi:hypothetical protein